MTSLNRVIISWQGASVNGAAATVLHYSASDNAAPPVAAIKSAFLAAAGVFPSGLIWTFPGTGDVIDDTTGNLVGAWTSSGGGTVNGGGPPQSAAGVGACIGWTTGGIVNGSKGPRKLRGRTFLVPTCSGIFDASGVMISANLATLQTLANALQAAGPLAVWHRPTTPGGSDGNSYGVISAKVRNKVAVLRSRRD